MKSEAALCCLFFLPQRTPDQALSKRQQKQTRKTRRQSAEVIQFPEAKFEFERTMPAIQPLTEKQSDLMRALKRDPQIIVLGPAGTGKTFIPANHAADLLRQKKIQKIILTRPNVPSGRSLGFFPGDINEKFAPWAAQIIEDIKARMGAGAFDIALKNGQIELVPFEVMCGRSFKNAFIILDEGQNTTPHEMKMFLTRQGEDSTVVVNGDISQSDLRESSGLTMMIHLAKKELLPVSIIEFGIEDIVRSGICAAWVRAFTANGI